MSTLKEALKTRIQKDFVMKIEVNADVILPKTSTSIDRVIRFLEYGDNNYDGINMFARIRGEYGFGSLNNLYRMYCMERLNYYTDTIIVTDRK